MTIGAVFAFVLAIVAFLGALLRKAKQDGKREAKVEDAAKRHETKLEGFRRLQEREMGAAKVEGDLAVERLSEALEAETKKGPPSEEERARFRRETWKPDV